MKIEAKEEFRSALLGWYDANARVLPWRVGPEASKAGARVDVYAVWLSEIMLQQTVVATVKDYFNRFLLRWPTVGDLARAQDAEVMGEWAGLGYYARARNLLACARAVVARGGVFPDTEDELKTLPGIGPYTAAAIAAIAYGQPTNVVDGNVERVMARLFAVTDPLPGAKPELTRRAATLITSHRPGEYAQALMDLGATVCTPKALRCDICPVSQHCDGRAKGIAQTLPAKTAKPKKPTRFGTAYVARRRDGAILLLERPKDGLLGGMMGFPGSDWHEEKPEATPPFKANWKTSRTVVRHTFTHFHLFLDVHVASVPLGTTAPRGQFVPAGDFDTSQLPTVMRKVYQAGETTLRDHDA